MGLGLGFLGVVAAMTAVRIPSSNACSIRLPPPSLKGYPADGATAVPTDVIPTFNAFLAGDGSSSPGSTATFTLQSQAGATIALTRRTHFSGHIELVPVAALQPRTGYELSVDVVRPNDAGSPYRASVKFTTGDGPFVGPPPPPVVKMEHYARSGAYTSCDIPPNGTCLSSAEPNFIEEIYLDGANDPTLFEESPGVQGPHLFQAGTFTDLSGVDQHTNFIGVRLRTRAPNGTFSAPITLYGKDAAVLSFSEGTQITCGAGGLSPAGQLVRAGKEPTPTGADPGPTLATNEGCQVASGMPGAPGLGLAGALLAAAAARRSRRRRATMRA